MKYKLLSFLMCIIVIISLFSTFDVSAETINAGKITVATVDGITGDTVAIPISITENPGIMAVTISVTYDASALTYQGFGYGSVLNEYTIQDHSDENLVRVVLFDRRTKYTDGKLLALKFKIAENAEYALSKIDIEYKHGDFCNWNQDKIMPTILSGGVNVAFNGGNCSHTEYGEWSEISPPSCKNNGLEQRICKKCGHTDFKETKPIGHEYLENWTIDKPATANTPGTMSRYCIRCNHFVDRITFTLDDSKKNDFNNEIWEDIKDNEPIKEIFYEQNPDKELTPSKPKPEDTPQNNISDSDSPTDNNLSEKSEREQLLAIFPNFELFLKIIQIGLYILIALVLF